MEIYYIVTFFIFGIVFGSFFNVVGYRLPRGESIINPPSKCPKCDHQLSSKELIPIFSYLIQKGKCRNCQAPIPPYYAFFELFTGFLFALSYYTFGFTNELPIALLFSSMAIILIVSDYHFYIIPDEVLIFSIITIMSLIVINNGFLELSYSLINAIIAFASILTIKLFGDFIFKKESMGGGDIKLLFVFGLIIGWEMAILAIILGAFIGLPVALFLMINKKIKERIIPFGPFLCVAALVLYFTQYDVEKFIDFLLKIRIF